MGAGKVRAVGFTISLDGHGAGLGQSLDNPMGKGGGELHQWAFPTRTFQATFGNEGGTEAVDDDYARRSMAGFGAFMLGRNMFAPSPGEWTDDGWKGWWGDDPPYHAPTSILTHHPREPIVMQGGTTFHFVTDSIEAALDRARAAAGERDVKIGGGVATLRQYLAAKLVDEVHLVFSPVLLGQGEAVFAGLDLPALGNEVTERAATELATYVVLSR